MKKRVWFIAVPLALLLAALLFAARWYVDNRMPNFSRVAEIYVRPGMDADEVFETVCREAGVKNRRSLGRCFSSKDVASNMKVGHYTVVPSNPSVYVARMLNNGWQTPVKLSLSGNLRVKSNVAAKISSQLLLDSAAVSSALDSAEFLARYGFTPRTAFSLLVPTTYEVYWTASLEDVFSKMKANYDAFWTDSNVKKAEALGLTEAQVFTLASIVEAESNYEPEMPKIAGVYLNRLKVGMPLQADPTVAFCYGYTLSRILKEHLSVDSPYNTYTHTGLPPGPICAPGRASLEAVLNPDYGGRRGDGNFFFCADSDFSGKHVFAKTLTEHNRNAAAFHREMTRRSRARNLQ